MRLLIISVVSIFSFIMPQSDGYEIGDTVDNFTLKSVTGDKVSLQDFSNEKGVILIFDCNTCPFSQRYNDRIKALHAKFADKGFPVVAINPNDPKVSPGDSFEKMVSYAKDKNFSHYYLQDESQDVAKAFGATNTPHVFVLKNQQGNFSVAYIGAIDNNSQDASAATKHYVEDAVNSLIQGKSPSVTSAKAIGCTIKWKRS
jgi:peroxiredoxin